MRKSIVFTVTIIVLIILLSSAMLITVTGGSNADQLTPIPGEVDYALSGNNDMLYAGNDKAIYAIDGNGRLKYTFNVPENLAVCKRYGTVTLKESIDTISGSPIISSDSEFLYVYLRPDNSAMERAVPTESTYEKIVECRLIAVSSSGKIAWDLPVNDTMIRPVIRNTYGKDPYAWSSNAIIHSQNNRIYFFHEYNETVIDSDGSILWNLENISDPAAIDEDGFVYAAYAIRPGNPDSYPLISKNATYENEKISDYRTPGGLVDAYYPNGTLYWRKFTGEPAIRQMIHTHGQYSLPLYNNGMVYVPIENGIMALNKNGSTAWIKRLNKENYALNVTDIRTSGWVDPGLPDSIIENLIGPGEFRIFHDNPVSGNPIPFDDEGNLYLEYLNWYNHIGGSNAHIHLIVIDRDGNIISHRKISNSPITGTSGNTEYVWESQLEPPKLTGTWYDREVEDINDLKTDTLIASDRKTGHILWNYTIPTDHRTTAVLNSSNIIDLVPRSTDDIIEMNKDGNVRPVTNLYSRHATLYPGDDLAYISFRSINYEYPIKLNESKCVYSAGIYALDKKGSLVWYKPIDTYAHVIVTGNNTILYDTSDGKVFSEYIGAAAAMTIAAAFFLFIKFFLAGTVTRARSKLDGNENRNRVLRFIKDNPGSTLYEISRGIKMNLGTVRYHMLILEINHKVTQFKSDEKHVRYFVNSMALNKEEQLIITLMRRDGVRAVLGLLLERHGLSNIEISRELQMPESAVSRYMKELYGKGVVDKESICEGRYAYTISKEYEQRVSNVIKQFDNSKMISAVDSRYSIEA